MGPVCAARMVVSAVIVHLGIESAVRISVILYAPDITARLVDMIFALDVFA